MKKQKSTKHALLMSALAMLMCVSMLIGSTFAWFTDSVTSGNNKIVAGNLDVELEYMNSETADWTKVTATSNVFKQDTLWEPGHTEVVKLRISNAGSLALKYQLGINIVSETGSINKAGEDFKLSDYIYYGVVSGDQTYTRQEAVAAVKDNAELIKVSFSKPGIIEAKAEPQVVTLVVYMPESVGNEANHAASANAPQINLGINLVATQQTSESDSFGPNYDGAATYPAVSLANIPEGTTSATAITAGDVTVYIPAGASAGMYELKVDNKSVTTADETATVSYDISLYKDGVMVSGVMYLVEIKVGTLLDVVSVTHNGAAIADYDYSATQGVVSFKTDSFSPFAVTYKSIPAINVAFNEEGQIISGVFEGINPAELDKSLAEKDSEYIAINYVKDGKTYYTVSERGTTVVVAPTDTTYASVNGNYSITKVGYNELYTVFSGLASKDFSTVYILPGTYDAATTLTVSSSMDIIGLGDKEDIEIVRQSGSAQHLFNCNGSKEDYIQVTIQNLYLNVKVGATTKNKDVGAVQSIRRSKVKCYDLIVYKNEGYLFNNAAFYVNANNEVTTGSGVYCDAYLYVENTVINGAATVVSTSSKNTTPRTNYHFYHSNLTYSNGTKTYTNNSTYIKNQVMAADDWNW